MEKDGMQDFFDDPDNGWGFEGDEAESSNNEGGDNNNFGDAFGDSGTFGGEAVESELEDEFSALGGDQSSYKSEEPSYSMDNYTPSLPEPGPIQSAIHDINSSESKTKRLATLLMVGGGVAVLIITLAVAGYLGSHKGNAQPVENKHVKIEKETVAEKDNSNKSSETLVVDSNNWQKLSGYSPLNEGTKIKSSFTITDIEYYAVPVNGQSDKQVKAVLTGSISGLVGTYQLEVGYSVGGKLNIGNSFDITYNLIEADGYRVIDGISY